MTPHRALVLGAGLIRSLTMRRGTVTSLLALGAYACGAAPGADDESEAGGHSSSEPSSDSSGESSNVSSSDSSSDSSGEESGSDRGPQDSEDTDGSCDDSCEPEPPICEKNVVLMGYWPPTNEMLRQWSTSEVQNPDGWKGENWRELGYDVYAFFPEFPPDGDPTNDAIGDDGAVGSPDFDLRVDYQATSADFWRIVDTFEPIVLLTTSRGGSIGWEIEAIEGGHGLSNPNDPSLDWSSDRHGDEHFPTQASIESRSWDAISELRQGVTLPTALPVEAIFDAASALELTSVEIDETGTSGNFLSGFLGLHGLYYNLLAQHNAAAGHIHVGFGMPVATAEQLVEATLEAVLLHHPAADAPCR